VNFVTVRLTLVFFVEFDLIFKHQHRLGERVQSLLEQSVFFDEDISLVSRMKREMSL